MEGLFESKTYMAWRNMLYAAGYSDTPIVGDMRHLSTSELEQIERYFRGVVSETPRKNRIVVANAILQIQE